MPRTPHRPCWNFQKPVSLRSKQLLLWAICMRGGDQIKKHLCVFIRYFSRRHEDIQMLFPCFVHTSKSVLRGLLFLELRPPQRPSQRRVLFDSICSNSLAFLPGLSVQTQACSQASHVTAFRPVPFCSCLRLLHKAAKGH